MPDGGILTGPILAATAIGGAASLGGIFGAGAVQSNAFNKASSQAANAGKQAETILQGGATDAQGKINEGFGNAQNYFGQAGGLLQGGQQTLNDVFGQERKAGNAALQRLQDVLLNGNMGALQMDPGYGFRQQQGEQAIQRQAAAAGSFGSGGNLKDFARFNQGLASQEYGAAINRLMGLQGIGGAANANFASLNQNLLTQQSNLLGQQAGFAANQGGALANILSDLAANRANLRTGTAQQVAQYDLGKAQAVSNAIGAGANVLGNVGSTFAFGAMQGGGGGASPFGGGNFMLQQPNFGTPQMGAGPLSPGMLKAPWG